MKTHYFIICNIIVLLLNCVPFSPSLIHAQYTSPVLTGQRSLGSTAFDEFRGMTLTDDGGCIVAGLSGAANGDVNINKGGADFWILKFDSTFLIQWQQVLGGTKTDWARDIKPTLDAGYAVLGYSKSTNGQVSGNHGDFDFWLVKLSKNGMMEWQKTMGGSSEDNGYTVEETPDAGYICSGYSFSSDGDVNGHHALDDGWVVKLDAFRNIQWQRSLGGSLSDQIDDVILTTDDGYLLVGYTSSVDGDVTLNHGGQDMWVIKLDRNGNLLWQKSYGGTKDDAGREGVQTADGGFIIVGFSCSKNGDATTNKGGQDLWIIKIDGNGKLMWQHSYGSSKGDYAYTIEAASDGKFLVAGYSGSSNGDAIGNHGNLDMWLIMIDIQGNLLWQKNLGGTLMDVARSCGEKEDGSILVAGFTKSNDGDVSGQHGGNDGWVASLDFLTTPDESGDSGDWSRATTAPFGFSDKNPVYVALYPNPVVDRFTLHIQLSEAGSAAISASNKSASIFILNDIGQIIYSSQEVMDGELSEGFLTKKKIITMPSSAASGWYIVRVVLSDQVIARKLLYQKW